MLFFMLGANAPLYTALMYLLALILALCVHEAAHGWMAYKLGDPTARNLGKITIDPRAHFTRLSFFLMLLFPIGFANCPINPRNFKKPARDERLVALAGPFSNLLLGFAFFMVMALVAHYFIPIGSALSPAWDTMASIMIFINIWLFIINLLPIPPLDGFKVISNFLSWKTREAFQRMERYGFLILILVINFFAVPFNFALMWIIAQMSWVIQWMLV